jgi:hypothetical protein
MGLLSLLGLGRRKPKASVKRKAAPTPVRSAERQQMEADILANMRKISQKLAEAKDSPFSGASEEEIMAGLRRWTNEQK